MEEVKKEEMVNGNFSSEFMLAWYFLLSKKGVWNGGCGDLRKNIATEYQSDPDLQHIRLSDTGLGRAFTKHSDKLDSIFNYQTHKKKSGANVYDFYGVRISDEEMDKLKSVILIRLKKDSVKYSARDVAGMCDAGVSRYVWGEPDLYSEMLAAKVCELKEWLEKYIGDMRKEMDRENKQVKAENKQLKKECCNAIKQMYKAMMIDSVCDCDNPLPHAP